MTRDTIYGRTPVLIALTANLGIFCVKLVSGMLTGSAVIFSETLHSLADCTNSVFLLIGLRLALRPADRKHPFGYGKEAYFWSFVAAMFMLGVISVGSVWRGERQLVENNSMTNIDIAMAGLAISILLESIAVFFAMRGLTRCADAEMNVCTKNPFKAFLKVHDPTLKLIFVEDLTAFFGALLALGAIVLIHQTDIHSIDGYASIIIGVTLGILAIFLAIENREKLIGAATDEVTENRIREIATGDPAVKGVLNIKTMYMGMNKLIVHMRVELEPEISLEKLDDVLHKVERKVMREFPDVIDCLIEPFADMDESVDEY